MSEPRARVHVDTSVVDAQGVARPVKIVVTGETGSPVFTLTLDEAELLAARLVAAVKSVRQFDEERPA